MGNPFLGEDGFGSAVLKIPQQFLRRADVAAAFQIAGYELGLDPDPTASKPGAGGVAYWRVDELDGCVRHFVTAGATVVAPIRDVGDGVRVATVADPFGNVIGLLENPHFRLPEQ